MKKTNLPKLILALVFLLFFGALTVFLAIDLIEPISLSIQSNDLEPLFTKFASYGYWAPFFITIFQTLQLLIVFLPSQLTHMIAGFMLGPIWGFIACISGMIIGNILIYLLVRKFGPRFLNIFSKKQVKKLENITLPFASKKFMGALAVMYLVPGIPYGLIAFTAANSKLRFPRYVFITTLASAPTLLLGIGFGNISHQINWIYTLLIALLLIIIAGIAAAFYPKIMKKLMSMPQKYGMDYYRNNVRKPRPLLYGAIVLFLKLFFFPRFRVKIDKTAIKDVKQPAVIIFNHPSKYDFIWSFVPLHPWKINAVTAYYYFCHYDLGWLIHQLGAFPKMLFQPDLKSMRNILKVKKNHGNLGLAPEGRLSAYGTLESITPATGKLLKNLEMNVIYSQIHGSYFTFPKWSKFSRKGRVEIKYSLLFSASELAHLSIEEIDDRLFTAMNYDEYAWQAVNQVPYKGKKFAEGLEHILYLCPVCHQEYSLTAHGSDLECQHCHTKIHLNPYYDLESDNDLIPKNIRDWYLWQKQVEKENIAHPDYSLSSHVKVKLPDPKGKGFALVGEGTTTLSKQGVFFTGILNGEPTEILFKLQNVP
ncbi:MAG TPA: VTT domain-containing protein, partial [Bacilli bacterium]|nr:VTT domain-containing protein [Bacilli bacterium]